MRHTSHPINEQLERDARLALLDLSNPDASEATRSRALSIVADFADLSLRIGQRRTATARRIENEMAL